MSVRGAHALADPTSELVNTAALTADGDCATGAGPCATELTLKLVSNRRGQPNVNARPTACTVSEGHANVTSVSLPAAGRFCAARVGGDHAAGSSAAIVRLEAHSAIYGDWGADARLVVWFPESVTVRADDPTLHRVRDAGDPTDCNSPLFQSTFVRVAANFSADGWPVAAALDVTPLVTLEASPGGVVDLSRGAGGAAVAARGVGAGAAEVSLLARSAGAAAAVFGGDVLSAAATLTVTEAEVTVTNLEAVAVTRASWRLAPLVAGAGDLRP
eukprot:1194416-Prorocentrum_minimum.AAC.2